MRQEDHNVKRQENAGGCPAFSCRFACADTVPVDGPSGSVAIVDYKTGALVTNEEASASLQLGYYVIAAREHPDVASEGPVSHAEMWFPMHALKRSIATRALDVSRLGEIEDRMKATAHGISIEDWAPTPGTGCQRCPVRVVCPAVPEGKEAFDPEEMRTLFDIGYQKAKKGIFWNKRPFID